jgi:tetratricopeptide (TPR) repeat protein
MPEALPDASACEAKSVTVRLNALGVISGEHAEASHGKAQMTVDEEDGETDLELATGLARLEQLASDRKREQVVELATTLIAAHPRAIELYHRRAHSRYALGDVAGALRDLTEAIAVEPTEPAFYFFRGLWAIDSGARATAIADLGEAIERDAALGSIYYTDSARFVRAVVFLLEGDFSSSDQELRKLKGDVTSFVAGKVWSSAQLRRHIAARRRP